MTNNDTQTLLEYAGTLDKIYKYSVPAYQAIDFNAGAVIRELVYGLRQNWVDGIDSDGQSFASFIASQTLESAASLIEGKE